MAALLNEWFMFSAMASGAEEHSGSLEKHTSDISIFLPTLKIWIDLLGQILESQKLMLAKYSSAKLSTREN